MPDPRVDPRDLLDAEAEQARTRLAALRADLSGVMAASRDSNADDEHDPEGSTIAFERQQIDALAAQARAQLDEVAAARERWAEGTYGTCEGCGQAIAPGRLQARPTARTCVACASASHR